MLREASIERLSSAFPSCVEIDCDALAANARWIKALTGKDVQLMAVVKANAYGHGAVSAAKIALRNGADMLAVANISEAIELRDAGIDAPILLLGMTPADSIQFALALNLRVTVYDVAQARQLQACAAGSLEGLIVHVKVDTGMGRLGVVCDDAMALCDYVRRQRDLLLEGLYTHFSTADDDLDYAAEQLSRFNSALVKLHGEGFRFRYVHAANSAAVLACRGSRFNLVRPGLLLYGLNPLAGGKVAAGLRPALSWKTRVAQVKTLPAGSPVGYGNAYRTRGRETIAVLPVGYADGLRRSPLTWREVLVHGLRAPLVGRVSMEKVTINVSHIPDVRMGDEVVLLGKQGRDEISADEIAEWIGSINYEVVTSIAPRVPRTYL
ncbi:MAG: alanine racemase [Chloroflexi bacterium]|nr:alanine racemase [Chloroflexota bacterium]